MNAQVVPTLTPPALAGGYGTAAVGLSEPTLAAPPGPDGGTTSTTTLQAPQLQPPAAAATTTAVAEAGAAATWHSGVTVDALWIADEVRNVWMHVATVGWKKVFNGSNGAFTALVTLAAQARQTGRGINCREEADGMIREIYLW